MRRSSRAVAASVCVGSLLPTMPSEPAHAQLTVVCPNCFNLIIQTMQLANEAASLEQQIAMY